ncbi:MAG: sulfatase-like hydrolase/transferase [Rhodocyclaceae bacterium]|nr:sulfatase-like hydrolase/transferase [Rhodocyclaceae bacterium]
MRALFKFFGYLLGTLLLVVSSWIHDEYGRVTIDQVLYHIGFGTDALLASDPELSLRLIHEVAWPAFGTGILLTLCDAFVTRAGRHRLARTLAGSHGLLQGAARVATAVADRVLASLAALYRHRPHLLMPLAGLFQFGYSFAVVDYVRAHYGPDLFAAAYVDPARVTKRGGEPTNLVVIYVESLENTYADPALFGHDLLARLNRLKPQGISFDAYHEVLGAHFTIAGLVSTQCGIPLRSLAMFLGNKQGERIGRFLPRASCLGDILHHNGYTNVFLNGSSLEFAGVGKFFREHHFDKIMGREEWLQLGASADQMSGWGLHDDDLFARAREELDRLKAAGKPFHLDILTIDTHHPRGHLSRRCRERGVADFEGIVECTADTVAEFVEYVIDRGWLADTAVVIQGDHLAMGNTVYPKLTTNPQRTVFNLILGGRRPLTKNTDTVTHFDMLPTMLELAGLTVVGERAGLGYTAIGDASVPRPGDRLAHIGELTRTVSPGYRQLWEPPPPTLRAGAPDREVGDGYEFDFSPGAG